MILIQQEFNSEGKRKNYKTKKDLTQNLKGANMKLYQLANIEKKKKITIFKNTQNKSGKTVAPSSVMPLLNIL